MQLVDLHNPPTICMIPGMKANFAPRRSHWELHQTHRLGQINGDVVGSLFTTVVKKSSPATSFTYRTLSRFSLDIYDNLS